MNSVKNSQLNKIKSYFSIDKKNPNLYKNAINWALLTGNRNLALQYFYQLKGPKPILMGQRLVEISGIKPVENHIWTKTQLMDKSEIVTEKEFSDKLGLNLLNENLYEYLDNQRLLSSASFQYQEFINLYNLKPNVITKANTEYILDKNIINFLAKAFKNHSVELLSICDHCLDLGRMDLFTVAFERMMESLQETNREAMLRIIQKIPLNFIRSDIDFYSTFISKLIELKEIKYALELYSDQVRYNRIVFLSFINYYSAHTTLSFKEIEIWYKRLLENDYIPTKQILTGIILQIANCNGNHSKTLEKYYKEFTVNKIKPDLKVFNAILSVLLAVNDTKSANAYIKDMEESNIKIDLETCLMMLKLHVKSKSYYMIPDILLKIEYLEPSLGDYLSTPYLPDIEACDSIKITDSAIPNVFKIIKVLIHKLSKTKDYEYVLYYLKLLKKCNLQVDENLRDLIIFGNSNANEYSDEMAKELGLENLSVDIDNLLTFDRNSLVCDLSKLTVALGYFVANSDIKSATLVVEKIIKQKDELNKFAKVSFSTKLFNITISEYLQMLIVQRSQAPIFPDFIKFCASVYLDERSLMMLWRYSQDLYSQILTVLFNQPTTNQLNSIHKHLKQLVKSISNNDQQVKRLSFLLREISFGNSNEASLDIIQKAIKKLTI
jgi:hypothetical protein